MTTWQWTILLALVRIISRNRSRFRMTNEEESILDECLQRNEFKPLIEG